MPADHDADSTAVNLAFCKALGITDTRYVVAVNLAIRPGRMPQVTVVSRAVRPGCPAAIDQVVRQFDLDLRARSWPARSEHADG